jgi:hypothetical protein
MACTLYTYRLSYKISAINQVFFLSLRDEFLAVQDGAESLDMWGLPPKESVGAPD